MRWRKGVERFAKRVLARLESIPLGPFARVIVRGVYLRFFYASLAFTVVLAGIMTSAGIAIDGTRVHIAAFFGLGLAANAPIVARWLSAQLLPSYPMRRRLHFHAALGLPLALVVLCGVSAATATAFLGNERHFHVERQWFIEADWGAKAFASWQRLQESVLEPIEPDWCQEVPGIAAALASRIATRHGIEVHEDDLLARSAGGIWIDSTRVEGRVRQAALARGITVALAGLALALGGLWLGIPGRAVMRDARRLRRRQRAQVLLTVAFLPVCVAMPLSGLLQAQSDPFSEVTVVELGAWYEIHRLLIEHAPWIWAALIAFGLVAYRASARNFEYAEHRDTWFVPG